MNKVIYLFYLIILLQGCSPSAENNYRNGYNDGFKEGYNTVCKIDTTPAKGDWDNKDYIIGYNAGQLDGASKANYAAGAGNCKTRGAFFR
jgi:hypothetical protein